MDMIITTGEPETKTIDDWDFTFIGGHLMPVTLDLAAGDTIEFSGALTKIFLAEKPSPSNPQQSLPSENLTIFNAQLLSIQPRSRQVAILTPEQKWDWSNALEGKTVQ